MQAVRHLRLTGLMLVMVLAVATALAGLAHRAPAVDEQARVAAALAGYDLEDLCGDLPAGHGNSCPFCTLVATPPVSSPHCLLRDADLRLVAEVVAPRESRAVRPVLDPARGTRAPPVA